MKTVPDRSEAAEYYFTYIDRVPPGDIRRVLDEQLASTLPLLRGISEEQSLHRYAPEKWSLREVVAHVNDSERVFVFRANWLAREFGDPLPSFDQNIAARAAQADDRPWSSHVDELQAIRAATLAFLRALPANAWDRRGTAGGNPFTVRALAYIVAGHLEHHMAIVRERYLRT